MNRKMKFFFVKFWPADAAERDDEYDDEEDAPGRRADQHGQVRPSAMLA